MHLKKLVTIQDPIYVPLRSAQSRRPLDALRRNPALAIRHPPPAAVPPNGLYALQSSLRERITHVVRSPYGQSRFYASINLLCPHGAE